MCKNQLENNEDDKKKKKIMKLYFFRCEFSYSWCRAAPRSTVLDMQLKTFIHFMHFSCAAFIFKFCDRSKSFFFVLIMNARCTHAQFLFSNVNLLIFDELNSAKTHAVLPLNFVLLFINILGENAVVSATEQKPQSGCLF